VELVNSVCTSTDTKTGGSLQRSRIALSCLSSAEREETSAGGPFGISGRGLDEEWPVDQNHAQQESGWGF
jgi:hypothetical protein